MLERKQPAASLDLLDVKEKTKYFSVSPCISTVVCRIGTHPRCLLCSFSILQEQWAFAQTLEKSLNSIRAILMHHCLAFERDQVRLGLTPIVQIQFGTD